MRLENTIVSTTGHLHPIQSSDRSVVANCFSNLRECIEVFQSKQPTPCSQRLPVPQPIRDQAIMCLPCWCYNLMVAKRLEDLRL